MRSYSRKFTGMLKITAVVLLIFSFVLSAFSLSSFAHDNYAELWAEKMAYEEPSEEGKLRYTTSDELHYGPYFYGDFAGEGGDRWGYGFEFLPFTEQGKKLKYKYFSDYPYEYEGAAFSNHWNRFDEPEEYLCIELSEYYEEYFEECSDSEPFCSMYRFVIQKLGITADELREAYRKMVEEPEDARQVLSELSDDEFEAYVKYLKKVDIPENFMIEGACIKDDAKGESLLATPGLVYVKELGGCIEAWDLFILHQYSEKDFQNFDLTTDGFKVFFADMKAYFNYNQFNGGNFFDHAGLKDELGRTPRQRFEALYAEYERQLENPKTGEEFIFVPLAIISFTLGAVIITKKRKSEFKF